MRTTLDIDFHGGQTPTMLNDGCLELFKLIDDRLVVSHARLSDVNGGSIAGTAEHGR